MIKVLANDGISELGVQILKENGFEVNTKKIDQEDLIQKINEENYEVLLVKVPLRSEKT